MQSVPRVCDVGGPVAGLSPVPRLAQLDIVSNAECEAALGAGRVSSRMVCAGRPGADTCQVLN